RGARGGAGRRARSRRTRRRWPRRGSDAVFGLRRSRSPARACLPTTNRQATTALVVRASVRRSPDRSQLRPARQFFRRAAEARAEGVEAPRARRDVNRAYVWWARWSYIRLRFSLPLRKDPGNASRQERPSR